MVHPGQINDIAAKLEMLADDAQYETFKQQWKTISFAFTWDEVVQAHLAIFQTFDKKV